MKQEYLERIRTPWPYLVAQALVIAILLTLVLDEVLIAQSMTGQRDLWNTTAIFFTSFGLFFVMLWFTKSIKVSVENRLLFTGKRGPTLIIRGGRHNSKTYIPLYMIENVTEVVYQGSRVETLDANKASEPQTPSRAKQQTRWKTFFHIRDEHGEVPVGTSELFGYEGPGLEVSYRSHSLNSGGKELLWKQQFPTQEPELLKQVMQDLAAET